MFTLQTPLTGCYTSGQVYDGPPLGLPPMVSPCALPSPTLGEAIKECLTIKEHCGLSKRYLQSLGQYLRLFSQGRENVPIGSLSADNLRAWFKKRKEIAITESSNRGRLASLFHFAQRRKWIASNIVDDLDRLRLTHKPVTILNVADAEKLLRTVRLKYPRWLAFLVLAMLAGIRPEELAKLEWSDIALDRRIVTISAAASKVRRRRIVKLDSGADAWLRVARQAGSRLPVPTQCRRRVLYRLRFILGLERWPHDVLRHTYASYAVAKHQDVARISLWMGNSPKILLDHYHEIVSEEDAKAFWSIRP